MATDERIVPSRLLVVAAVFGVPVGVGVSLAAFRVTGSADPAWAILAGGGAGLLLALSIAVLGATGSVDPEFDHS